jgi:hypothetical protein
LTRLWLAVWRWYNKGSYTQEMKNWWNNKRLQPPVLSVTFIHRSGRSSKSRRITTTVYTSLSNNRSDELPPNLHFTRLVVSAEHKVLTCWATTTDSITTCVILDPKRRNLMKAIIIIA